jgi:hypothetical protein
VQKKKDKDNSKKNEKEKKNDPKKSELLQLKKKIIELKKSIVYTNALDNKLVEVELNTTPRTSRTFRSLDLFTDRLYDEIDIDKFHGNTLLLPSNRSASNTNRTGKSVRFDEALERGNLRLYAADMSGMSGRGDTAKTILKATDSKTTKQSAQIDPMVNEEVNKKYEHLLDKLEWLKGEGSTSRRNITGRSDVQENFFSLSLPLTPRSIDGTPFSNIAFDVLRTAEEDGVISKFESKSLEMINDKINLDFLDE